MSLQSLSGLIACAGHHILVSCLFSNKTVFFLFRFCGEFFGGLASYFVFNYISLTPAAKVGSV